MGQLTGGGGLHAGGGLTSNGSFVRRRRVSHAPMAFISQPPMMMNIDNFISHDAVPDEVLESAGHSTASHGTGTKSPPNGMLAAGPLGAMPHTPFAPMQLTVETASNVDDSEFERNMTQPISRGASTAPSSSAVMASTGRPSPSGAEELGESSGDGSGGQPPKTARTRSVFDDDDSIPTADSIRYEHDD